MSYGIQKGLIFKLLFFLLLLIEGSEHEEKTIVIKQINKLMGINDKVYIDPAIAHLKKDADVKKIDCPVCFTEKEFSNFKILACGHLFCTVCIHKLQNGNSGCPSCRGRLVPDESKKQIKKIALRSLCMKVKLLETAVEEIGLLSSNYERMEAIKWLKKALSVHNPNHYLLSKKNRGEEQRKNDLVGFCDKEIVLLNNLPHRKQPAPRKGTKLEQTVTFIENFCQGGWRQNLNKHTLWRLCDSPERLHPSIIQYRVLTQEWLARCIFHCLFDYKLRTDIDFFKLFLSLLSGSKSEQWRFMNQYYCVCTITIFESVVRVTSLMKDGATTNSALKRQMMLSVLGWFLVFFLISYQGVVLLLPTAITSALGSYLQFVVLLGAFLLSFILN